MKYKNPKLIYSPKDLVKEVEIIYDGGESSFSIAKLKWGNENVIGIRWNVAHREWKDQNKIDELKECIGVPSSRGYPTWFILPNEILDKNSSVSEIIAGINYR